MFRVLSTLVGVSIRLLVVLVEFALTVVPSERVVLLVDEFRLRSVLTSFVLVRVGLLLFVVVTEFRVPVVVLRVMFEFRVPVVAVFRVDPLLDCINS